jgi:hypothetical protein
VPDPRSPVQAMVDVYKCCFDNLTNLSTQYQVTGRLPHPRGCAFSNMGVFREPTIGGVRPSREWAAPRMLPENFHSLLFGGIFLILGGICIALLAVGLLCSFGSRLARISALVIGPAVLVAGLRPRCIHRVCGHWSTWLYCH